MISALRISLEKVVMALQGKFDQNSNSERMNCTWIGMVASIYAWKWQKDLLIFMRNQNQGLGYLAPEYAMRGYLTEKADVFSFGIIALEILSEGPNSNNSLEDAKIYLTEWAWHLHENDQILGLVDPALSEFDTNEATRLIGVAFLCTQASSIMRPSLSRMVAMLTGDIETSNVVLKPSYLTDLDFKDITSSLLNENESSTSSTAQKEGKSQ
ncbi:Tyrosine-protein kinase [Parasponia andersonii]|uniref:Tyrosine-protein kinase n=1 Tax=Parasponia andersonii TaxID=3476 RepID=A0A2P5AV62_PARAD|nr:Tyrosine-protein kinase [Parasponia andersonii]